MEHSIFSVIGCGWLGFPLAQKLIEDGHSVSGSTTRVEQLPRLRDAGITAALLRLDPPQGTELTASASLTKLLSSPTLVLTIPPSAFAAGASHLSATAAASEIGSALGSDADPSPHLMFSKVLEELIDRAIHIGKLSQLLFISSTSVYGDVQGEVTELSPLLGHTENARSLIAAEQMLLRRAQQGRFGLTIVRPAGLIGFGRHPGRFLAGKTGLKDPDQRVNLIHQTDLNNCLRALLLRPRSERPANGEAEYFNAAASSHPTRSEYYSTCARQLNLPLPQFDPQDPSRLPGKTVAAYRLKDTTGVAFEFDDLMTYVGEKPNVLH